MRDEEFGEIELGVRSEEINRRARGERRDTTINSQRALRSGGEELRNKN